MESTDVSSLSRTLTENHQIHNTYGNAQPTVTGTGTNPASVDHRHDFTTPADSYFGGANEIIEIMEEDEEILMSSSSPSPSSSSSSIRYKPFTPFGKSGGQQLHTISESGIETNTTSLFSIDIHNTNSGRLFEDVVYVAVGKSESSMDALQWTLEHFVNRGSTLVYLIHIFSDVKFIPSPFGGGMVPKTQVSPDLVENYVAQETRKRRDLLTKYVDKCTSHMVQVETILIESDSVANAIVELIPVLNIRQLVVGISKSNLRKVKVGKGSATVAEQIRHRAGVGCELKIVYQGKEINMSELSELYFGHYLSHSPSTSSSINAASRRSQSHSDFDELQLQPTSYNSFSCCFKG